MCRVSTEAQDYEAQIGDLKKYAISKGITEWEVIATKESGYRDISEREGWLKTKQFFEEHPDYDTLIVTEISRLGRATQGVKIMNVADDVNIIALAKVAREEDLEKEINDDAADDGQQLELK